MLSTFIDANTFIFKVESMFTHLITRQGKTHEQRAENHHKYEEKNNYINIHSNHKSKDQQYEYEKYNND